MGRLRPELGPVAAQGQARGALQGIAVDGQTRQVRVASGMAQNDRQSERHELLDKAGVIHLDFKFAQFAPMPQHQLAQAVQLIEGEAGQVGVVQDVSAMLVVIAVRDAHAGFVQLAGPVKFLQIALTILR